MKKPDFSKLKDLDVKKAAKDFVYGKPHGERRLGDLYIPKTGLYKHREWRGIKDTMYYFNNIWLYNYGKMVMDIVELGGPKGLIQFLKGCYDGYLGKEIAAVAEQPAEKAAAEAPAEPAEPELKYLVRKPAIS